MNYNDTVLLIDSKLNANIIDSFWLMYSGLLVFFMQAGFAMLETGAVSSKNAKNILTKNLLDACIGALIWWCVGYGIAYDGNDNAFIGTITAKNSPSFFTWDYSNKENNTGLIWALWFFQYVFAATASTIVSGAVAERTQLLAYVIYTSIITMFIYPVVVHWAWSSSGWISPFNPDKAILGGVIDFAGSGVVHMTGGIAGLSGAYFVGPRINRFINNKPSLKKGHSVTLQILGTFILWLGWYGFNAGSTLGLSGINYTRDAARIMVTTTLSAASGGLTSFIIDKYLGTKVWNPIILSNGILTGLVSITSGCSVVQPWAAVIIGSLGSVIYICTSNLMLYKFNIDDPLDAFAIHGAGGIWGVLSASLFADSKYSYTRGGGLFYGNVDAFGAAIIFILSVIVWVGGLSVILFKTMRKMRILRITEYEEKQGLDISKHGGSAYDIEITNIES